MILSFSLMLILVFAGCRGSDSESGDTVRVTASTTQAADIARNVVGDRGAVDPILTANSDPHDYEPKPSDAQATLEADLVIKSGGDVDEWFDEIIESSGSEAPVVTLMDSVPIQASEDEIDPHWWQNPQNVEIATRAIRDELIAVDPDGESAYEKNAESYIRQLRDLDGAVAACIEKVPEQDRKLVTSHDALGYYADRYGIEVIGTVIPARTTQAQASAGEVADLVAAIQDAGVQAIFPEAGVSSDLEQAVADEAGATIGGELWADALGPQGSDGQTYLEAVASNTQAIVEGLTGGGETCEIEVGD
jgi:zinc/manganese transport system substrate-binding protein/manganese/iron transport system substrate-binding protein